MCGICGYIGIREDGLLEAMTTSLTHRGPDSAGYFQSGDVGLGHRRLSIIDVVGGRQPIENEDQSLVLICNGEIYNYQSLREELQAKGHRFRTKSDSEVVLHLYEDIGPKCLDRLHGMFTIAIFDKSSKMLFLARDRLGIKPLYYVHLPNQFLFASESKSILRYTGFDTSLNPLALSDYLALRYVPGPGSMFREIHKFPAAHYGVFKDGDFRLHRYWEPELYDGPFRETEEEYLEGFAERFQRSIQRRLFSEVPLGAYLSGGVDSNTIVASMANIMSTPVRTFSVGFDFEHDELTQASECAKLLGCQHTEIACRVSDINLLPEIIYHLDEPVGDAIVIPMYQLAREAKKQVTVILSGEGADETLGGYLFHRVLLGGHYLERGIPEGIRRHLLLPLLKGIPNWVLNLAFQYPAALGVRGKLKVVDYLGLLGPNQLGSAYRHLISLFDERDTNELFTKDFEESLKNEHRSNQMDNMAKERSAPYLNKILNLQFEHWLPDDILMKQDKLSMAHGIEARVPFLDHELVEYILRVPPSLKIRMKQSKYLLRKFATRLLPEEMVSRKKMPFYVPVEKYISDSYFQDLLADTLSHKSIRARGIFNPIAIDKLLQHMRQGEFIYVKQIFSLVVLELWFRMAVDRRGIA